MKSSNQTYLTNQTSLTSQNLLIKKYQTYSTNPKIPIIYKSFLYVKCNNSEKLILNNIINEIAANPDIELELHQYFIDPLTGERVDGLNEYLYLIFGNMEEIQKVFQKYSLL